MQTDQSAKQLVVERIKNATNILVTVSHDPSVDELSAALGLTLILNKLDKHATAVFSGKIPPAIEFLQPDKTFEDSVDSLRDFIIALDKEKADRLRYKVEDDVVRIFITPYRTVISQKDLQFSQGDFNVELVLALGVEKREDLDQAITAHGRILHDAPVVTINSNGKKSSLGAVDWSDGAASSLCEMLMGLSESLQANLLDEQISTALLTGIVAATGRFRNDQTSPRVMTMAAQLMAAGANQQLIAAKLEEGGAVTKEAPKAKEDTNPDGSKKLEENKSEKLKVEDAAKAEEQPETPAPPKVNGEMTIAHTTADDTPATVPTTAPAPEPADIAAASDQATQEAEAALDHVVEANPLASAPTLSVDDLQKDLAAASNEVNAAASVPDLTVPAADSPIGDVKGDWRDRSLAEPSFGGTLNATADEAEHDKRREELSPRNHELLSHDGSPQNEPVQYENASEPSLMAQSGVDVTPIAFTASPTPPPATSQAEPPVAPLQYEETPVSNPVTDTTLSELEASAHAAAAPNTLTDARAAVDAALNALPFDPADHPLEGVGAQPLGTVSHDDPVALTDPVQPPAADFSTTDPVLTPLPVPNDIPAAMPQPALPPLPDFSTLPQLPEDMPPVSESPHPALPSEPVPQAAPQANDPTQFKLPGQP